MTGCKMLKCTALNDSGQCTAAGPCVYRATEKVAVVGKIYIDNSETMRRALEKISSGMGGDLLGSTSLTREDMQEIARAAIAAAERGE